MEGRIGVRKFGGLFLSCFRFLKWVFFFENMACEEGEIQDLRPPPLLHVPCP